MERWTTDQILPKSINHYHCNYDCCQLCLKPLETAEQNVSRLAKQTISLPDAEEFCETDQSKIVQCVCSERYCSEECRQIAFQSFHQYLCPSKLPTKSIEILQNLCELWKSIHYPPETASIMLLIKILVMFKNDKKFAEKLKEFSHETIENNTQIVHKLCGPNFQDQIESIKNMVKSFFNEDEMLNSFWLGENFQSLLALIGKNSQGIGTSAFSTWARNIEHFVANDPHKTSQLNSLLDDLFQKIYEVSGDFLNNEGSGLYELQSCINHSCEANCEIHFPYNNYVLALKASKNIDPGDEITICYLNECMQDRSRHTRTKYLRENYLFDCECSKCQEQINDPDETSEDEADDSDLNSNDDDGMDCD
ncbi:DNA damage-binding protein 1-like [Sarcoptes scabiei]|nr:DNA damage-binding protein 1-like [Sarcoptes scabiei]